MQGKYKVITLCGSTRFFDEFISEMARLTLEGNIVIVPGAYGHHDPSLSITDDDKVMLDDMHKRKIDMADEIFVINGRSNDGKPYVGDSTRSEIEYAEAHGMPVHYLNEPLDE